MLSRQNGYYNTLEFRNDDDFGQIEEFQKGIQQEIQELKNKRQQKSENSQDKSLSLPVKLLIGGGMLAVILGLVVVIWYFTKKTRTEEIISRF